MDGSLSISNISDREVAVAVLRQSLVELGLVSTNDDDVISHGDSLSLVTHTLSALQLAVTNSSGLLVVKVAADLLGHHEMSIFLIEIEVRVLDIIVHLGIFLGAGHHLQIFILG